jgi:hypothetical protein
MMRSSRPAAILARLDAIMRELATLRAELAVAPAPARGNGLDAHADDFAPEHLLEISTAVGRFNRPADALVAVRDFGLTDDRIGS